MNNPKKIGQGTYGEVYSVYNDKLSSERIAMKIISRFDNRGVISPIELYILNTFNHTNILHSLHHEVTSKNTKIYTELADGDLSSFLNKYGPPPKNVLPKLLVQLASGLNFLHSQLIIHGDIKPGNILVFGKSWESCTLKICDFSLSIFMGHRNFCKSQVCSLGYRPLEVIKKLRWSYGVDIWAMGLVFYEMVYGKSLFNAKTESDLSFSLESLSYINLEPNKITHIDETCVFSKNWTDFENIIINELILSMLEIDSHNRLTSKEILEHDFFFKEEVIAVKSRKMVQIDSKYVTHRKLIMEKLEEYIENENLRYLLACKLLSTDLPSSSYPSYSVVEEEVAFLNQKNFELLPDSLFV